jgi:hypothetical protein
MPRRLRAVAIADLVFGALLAVLPWVALPARVSIVDGGATGLGILHLVAGAGLLTGRAWADRFARAAAWVLIGAGGAGLVALAISASFLWGVYGDVGRAGAVTIAAAIAVLVPYVFAYPILALVAMRETQD